MHTSFTSGQWRLLALSVLLTLTQVSQAQDIFDAFLKNKEGFKLEPFASFQLWSVYSLNHQVYNSNSKQYQAVEDRLNFMVRRARLGFRVQPFEDLRFNLILAYDAAGRDINSATTGATNNGAIPPIGIFDAFMDWRIKPKSENLFLVAGFFRPQISRESITPAWQVSSMEKAATQNYLRQHTTGVGPGRVFGVNFGGLLKNSSERVVLNYNLGIFNPPYLSNNGNSVGNKYSPLLAGRAVLSLGDPEMKQYAIMYNMNYFNKRKGISLALSGSRQGETDLYKSSSTLGTDVLLNWDGLNFDGEYHRMLRSGTRMESNSLRTFHYHSAVGHLRAGYNVILGKKYFLEPVVMYVHFQGAKDAIEQADALAVRSFAGSESAYDAGINWHLQERRLKVMLHYTWRKGDPGAAGDGATVNEFFNQPNVGAIRRGNWIGLGMNAIF